MDSKFMKSLSSHGPQTSSSTTFTCACGVAFMETLRNELMLCPLSTQFKVSAGDRARVIYGGRVGDEAGRIDCC